MTISLIASIHPLNPYEGFSLAEWPEDLQGWGSDHPVFERAIRQLLPRVIVEVGTWKGRSAVRMADVCKGLGLQTTIICIDTWLGSPEHFLRRDGAEWWPSLRVRHGYPQLYFQFLANVLHRGHQDMVVPLPQTSDNASVILRRLGIQAELIYVDAAHETEPVLRDLRNYWPIVTENGLILGDDFKHPPVAAAARTFAEENGLELFGEPRKFALSKSTPPETLGLPRVP